MSKALFCGPDGCKEIDIELSPKAQAELDEIKKKTDCRDDLSLYSAKAKGTS